MVLLSQEKAEGGGGGLYGRWFGPRRGGLPFGSWPSQESGAQEGGGGVYLTGPQGFGVRQALEAFAEGLALPRRGIRRTRIHPLIESLHPRAHPLEHNLYLSTSPLHITRRTRQLSPT